MLFLNFFNNVILELVFTLFFVICLVVAIITCLVVAIITCLVVAIIVLLVEVGESVHATLFWHSGLLAFAFLFRLPRLLIRPVGF